jgi:hypothetical protein
LQLAREEVALALALVLVLVAVAHIKAESTALKQQ